MQASGWTSVNIILCLIDFMLLAFDSIDKSEYPYDTPDPISVKTVT